MRVRDNFDDGNAVGWRTYGGADWTPERGAYSAMSSSRGLSLQDTDFSDLVYEADVTLRHSRSTSGLAFRVSRPGTGTGTEGFHGNYADLTVKGLVLGKATGDERTPLATARLTRAVGQTHRVGIEAVGTSLKVHVDDMAVPKTSTTDSAFATGAKRLAARLGGKPVRVRGDRRADRRRRRRRGRCRPGVCAQRCHLGPSPASARAGTASRRSAASTSWMMCSEASS
ncbi:hypothetical protein [Streptomyces sp. SH5]|uniref:hypothetical protein n=1 Tax=Streptomyces sp. SH5 TaxID=3041765 RepID=UPI0024780BBF|nr:hypothetical protein [Streptomyces sp. SH5]WGP08706.1 hypothetical protein QFA72_02980 [Streptomyces sp. SH5]